MKLLLLLLLLKRTRPQCLDPQRQVGMRSGPQFLGPEP